MGRKFMFWEKTDGDTGNKRLFCYNSVAIMKPERLFIIVAAFFGLLYCAMFPLGEMPDQGTNYMTAYRLADQLSGRETYEVDGDYKGYRNVYYVDMELRISDSVLFGEENAQYSELDDTGSYNFFTENNDYYLHHNIVIFNYFPFPNYLIPAIVIIVGRFLHIGGFYLPYVVRVFDLLIYIIIGYFSIRIMPIKKKIMYIFATMPVALSYASSINYNWALYSLILLFFSLLMKVTLEQDRSKIKYLAGLIIVSMILAPQKGAYVFYPFMMLIINNHTDDKVIKRAVWIDDVMLLRDYMVAELDKLLNVEVAYGRYPKRIERNGSSWRVIAQDITVKARFILNSTYASVNDVLRITDGGAFSPFRIKYEKCEIILCIVNHKLRHTGIMVMDGPFFSIMPFGKTGLHSLTTVTFTPHETSYDETASFPCQDCDERCESGNLQNCNECAARPASSWKYMSQLAKKYLRDEYEFRYYSSLYSMKPVLQSSEIDDSRPTVVRKHCEKPSFVSVLSGKIDTVYDLDEVLMNG